MLYSSNKWKKVQKILRRILFALLLLSVFYLYSRFSILSLSQVVDLQEKRLFPSYLLVDTQYHKGRNLCAGDVVICNRSFAYIIATSKNKISHHNNVLVVDENATLFSTNNKNFVLQQNEYLIYQQTQRSPENFFVVTKKEITSRVLMILMQK